MARKKLTKGTSLVSKVDLDEKTITVKDVATPTTEEDYIALAKQFMADNKGSDDYLIAKEIKYVLEPELEYLDAIQEAKDAKALGHQWWIIHQLQAVFGSSKGLRLGARKAKAKRKGAKRKAPRGKPRAK